MNQALKVVIAQLNYHTGNFDFNTHKIIQEINKAKSNGADLVVFSELCVCGYPPRDFLEFDDFVEQCNKAVEQIAMHCVGIHAIVGAPARNPVKEGKSLYNAAFVLGEQKIQQVIYKTLLPNYDIFDEYRYFEPNRSFKLVEINGCKIALTICEDLWNTDEHPLYVIRPMDELIKLNPHCIINIAASPFHMHQANVRKKVLSENVNRYHLPLIYVNHIGAQTQLIFDGGSLALNKNNEVITAFPYFKEHSEVVEIKFDADTDIISNHSNLSSVNNNLNTTISLIHDALVLGIKEYFHKQGFKQAILGLSGGIDSAVVLVLAARALGTENVRAVLLPSAYSSDHSIDDAKQLAERLKIRYDIIPIENTYQSFNTTLAEQFAGTSFNIAEENLQSRTRGVILMALSNKFGYILLNTSNKSELAVGYGTLYGDMCGGLSVIGDLYKTEVYELANFINDEQEIIPVNTIQKAPSAELRPNQKDADSLPDYALLDAILKHYIEERKSPKQIIDAGFEQALVNKVLRLVNINEWKRIQSPPVLRVSAKAFGPGRRMPIVAKYLN
ncbi:MAG: NAD+ synthase [Bacteroidia bacterium]|jgi:NAD+ synthase (glutamine-hydrolysing)|nr:NAD+ synthase [Bacteroidia bacterium]